MNFFRKNKQHDYLNDQQLLNGFRDSGDLVILANLYEKKMPLVFGVCVKYLKDEELAKDAVMGIFESLITKVKQHRIENFQSWLYVLSRNYCLMQLRQEKRMEVVNLDDFMEFVPFTHHDDNNREAAYKALEDCIERLSEAQKRSIDLFYLKEKCYKEIAELTGFNLNEVKSYIQNGRRNLKICLEKESA
jgi:RNA polymerase sigma-70 factor (ECF subfamily)